MRRPITAVVVGVILVTAFAFRAFQEPVTRSRLQMLKEGMTMKEVREVLGEPSKVYLSNRSTQWTYTKPLVFGFVNIHFKEDDTFDGEPNYERF